MLGLMGNWKSHEKQGKEANDPFVLFASLIPLPRTAANYHVYLQDSYRLHYVYMCIQTYIHTHTKKSCFFFLQFLKYLCITCVSGALVGQMRVLIGVSLHVGARSS